MNKKEIAFFVGIVIVASIASSLLTSEFSRQAGQATISNPKIYVSITYGGGLVRSLTENITYPTNITLTVYIPTIRLSRCLTLASKFPTLQLRTSGILHKQILDSWTCGTRMHIDRVKQWIFRSLFSFI